MRPHEFTRRSGEGIPVPLPWYGLGLIDTGAEVSCVNEGIGSMLGLEPVSRYRVKTPSGFSVHSVYQLRVTLGPGLDLPPDPIDVEVPEVEIDVGAMLIGRDILSHGEMAWYGHDEQFELVLPRSFDTTP